jgi:hypothetical protein
MRRWLLRRAIAAFGRTCGHDTSYMMAMRLTSCAIWRHYRRHSTGIRGANT